MKLLSSFEISYINRVIHEMSLYNLNIEYVRTTPTSYRKLEILTDCVPQYTTSMNIATYYMKNLIVLQCFPDGNHRTALETVRLFYHVNHVDFRWDPGHVVEYQKEIYKLRYKIYHTYEELPASIVTEPDNELWLYCRDCIRANLSKEF